MRMTLGQLVDQLDWGRLASICGRDSDGDLNPQAVVLVNRAQARMLTRGDWIGSTQVIRICLNNQCVTLPRQVERIDAAMLDGVELTMRNPWYEFMRPLNDVCGNGYFFGWGPFANGSGNLEYRGSHATFRDIVPGGKKLRVYPHNPADVGKTVYIQGVDDNNDVIYESPDYNGVKLVTAFPYVETRQTFSAVTGFIKEQTDYPVDLYDVDHATSPLTRNLLGTYDPSETTAELSRYRTLQVPGANRSRRCHSLLALVKLRHLPVARETDYLVIENPAAFEEMIRSLEKKDADLPQEAQVAELDAVRELNLEKRNRAPAQQVTARLRTQGTASPLRRGVGQIW